jgi:hypothetical protein
VTQEQPRKPASDGPARPVGRDRAYPAPLAYAGLGVLNAFCLLGGGALGWLLDHVLGTLPLFLMVGLVAGLAAGVLVTRSELRRYG